MLCVAGVMAGVFSLLAGCNNYAWVLFKENGLSSTPHMKVANHPKPKDWPKDQVTVTWIGHATALINFYGTVILTDPVLSERLAPPELFEANLGIRRITELPVTLNDLPPVDVVLLSHAHQDHWDMATLRHLDKKPVAIIPTGDSDLLPEGRFGKIVELAWGQKTTVADVTIQAFRVSHWGQRIGAADKIRGYNGYVVAGHGRTIVFIGDSAYGETVPAPQASAPMSWVVAPADWAARIGVAPADLCILPIGEYCYPTNHMTPEEAWSIFETINGRYLLASHWRTFILSPRSQLPTFEPMDRLRKAAGSEVGKIICDEPGKVFTIP